MGSTVLLSLFTTFEVIGREHLRDLPRPLLIVGNHKSFWDVPIAGLLIPFFSQKYYPVGFMTLDHFFRKPVVRNIMWLGGGVPAYKGQGLSTSLALPKLILQRKKVFVIFPFGIVRDGNYGTPGRGAATLVQEVPTLHILPVYMDTAVHLSWMDFFVKRPRMRVVVGKPFRIEDAKDRTTDAVTDILVGSIFALKKNSGRATE